MPCEECGGTGESAHSILIDEDGISISASMHGDVSEETMEALRSVLNACIARMERMDNRKICRVYWGSHGCCLPRGHEGDHWCDCCECEDHPEPGCVAGPPYFGINTHFYGDDCTTSARE